MKNQLLVVSILVTSIVGCENNTKKDFGNKDFNSNSNTGFIDVYDSLGLLVEKKRYANVENEEKSLQEYIAYFGNGEIDFDKSFFLLPITSTDTIYTNSQNYKISLVGYFQKSDSCEVNIQMNDTDKALKILAQNKRIDFEISNLKKGFNSVNFDIRPFIWTDSSTSKIYRRVVFNKVLYRN